MIDRVDAELKDWIQSVARGAEVWTSPPSDEREAAHIGLYLFALAEAPTRRGREVNALEIRLRYLITSSAPTPEEAHRLLGEVVFASLEREDFEVELGQVSPELWSGFGIHPRPAFILQVPLRRERHVPAPPRVKTLVTRAVPTEALVGQVLGPGDLPIAGAFVELPALTLVTQTDHRGWFRFPRVPAEPRSHAIRVRAKGEVHSFDAVSAPGAGEPVTLRLELREE